MANCGMELYAMVKTVRAFGLGSCFTLLCMASNNASASEAELQVALSLADVLRASRTEIANQQTRINDPTLADKGLNADVILQNIIDRLTSDGQQDPTQADRGSREGRLLKAQIESIREITNENQQLINTKGIGFKGFVPAVFTRLVNERFGEKVGDEAELKVTAPVHLVRNRKARPDAWERSVIEERFSSDQWPVGKLYSEYSEDSGGQAFRVMVPEYYGEACLSCHGLPKAETDITGYPKEGGAVGDLGGSISITLYQK